MASKGKPLSAVYDFNMNQGDDYRLQVQLKYDDDTPMNISGYEFKCRVRESAEDDNFIVEAEPNIISETEGIVEFHFRDEDTSQIDTTGNDYSELNKYTYDILMKNPDGEVLRVLNGYVFVSPGVSWH